MSGSMPGSKYRGSEGEGDGEGGEEDESNEEIDEEVEVEDGDAQVDDILEMANVQPI